MRKTETRGKVYVLGDDLDTDQMIPAEPLAQRVPESVLRMERDGAGGGFREIRNGGGSLLGVCGRGGRYNE